MIHLHDQHISHSFSPFPEHTQVTDTFFTFETTALQQRKNWHFYPAADIAPVSSMGMLHRSMNSARSTISKSYTKTP